MDNKQVFLNNNKQNYIKNLNASNAAKRLEEKVKSYNNNTKNNNLNRNNVQSQSVNNPSSKNLSTISRLNSAQTKQQTPKNSRATNELASGGLSAAGVPKPAADAIVNSKLGQKALEKAKKKNFALNMLDKLISGGKKETEEQASDGGGQNFKVSMKIVKRTLIASAPTLMIFIFCVLFVSATQIYINSIGFGSADAVSGKEAEEKIKSNENKINTEIKDETAFANFEDSSSLTFMNNRLSKSNLVQVDNEIYEIDREYNEADLEELNDYYSDVGSYSSAGYDMQTVYNFFFKLLYIQKYYRNKYNVYLDMPLIMATLRLQSSDMGVVFSSNTADYNDEDIELKEENPIFSYDYDWIGSGYVTSKDKSDHDIEILAQHMVSAQSSDMCDNPINDTCYILDDEKYREFLKEFIEKKYFLDEEVPLSGDDNTDNNTENNDTPQDSSNNSNSNNSNSNNNNSSNSNNNGSYRTWRQCGENWSSMIVPASNSSMCQIGCLITSITIQIARSGTATVETPINPGIALKYYSFVDGGNFVWRSTTNLAPNFVYYTQLTFVGMSKTNIAQKLNSFDPSKYYVVLAVSPIGVNSISHYVALDYVDVSSGSIYMMDPVSNDYTDLYSIYKLYEAHIYEKRD